VRQASGTPATFPLHYWQLGGLGLTEQFLLTAREHWPKPQQQPP